ncbi:MAG: SapC family protein [Methylotenera sp.]|nr:SapC family protein [Methylotenera sp.]
MAELIFYQNPVVLDEEKHADLKIKPIQNYAYAANAHAVPVVVGEFGQLALEFPIAFAKNATGSFVPLALMGLKESENLFVAEDGRWLGRYVPAFIRRYPFAVIEADEKMVLCLDEDAECFSLMDGESLFVDKERSPALKHALDFVEDYQYQVSFTQDFIKKLEEYDLLSESECRVSLASGASFNVKEMFVINQEKLQVLEGAALESLMQSGMLRAIYAHLVSLGNLTRLLEESEKQAAAVTD